MIRNAAIYTTFFAGLATLATVLLGITMTPLYIGVLGVMLIASAVSRWTE